MHRDVIGGATGTIGGEVSGPNVSAVYVYLMSVSLSQLDARNRGDVSMAQGTYDLYPETGDFEVYQNIGHPVSLQYYHLIDGYMCARRRLTVTKTRRVAAPPQ